MPGNLDLNIADEEEFSPDKLRANVERLYMTVIIGLINSVKHIARLRSWKETRRTSCFCIVCAHWTSQLCTAKRKLEDSIPDTNVQAGILRRMGIRPYNAALFPHSSHTDRLPAISRHFIPSSTNRAGR